MAPNSRPPLTSVTSRLRKSFEGKRSKSEVTSPISTNGFISQDPEAFRNAIDEAISSETFQTAIAANLARLIKPSIKDALDTLQPVVEAVYSHEVLLRKTNRSVEDILIRLDTTQSRRESIAEIGSNGNSTPTPGTPTSPRRRRVSESSNPRDDEQFKTSLEKSNKRTVATLAELSNVIDGNNKKIAEAVAGVQTIQTSLIPTKEALDSLRAFSEESNTKTAVMQAQLDQLQADIGSIIESVKSGMGQNQGTRDIDATADHPAFAAHTLKLDAISADIGSLRVQSDFAGRIGGINDAIVALKGSVDASANTNIENFGSLATHLAQVLNGVEGHGENLAAIKDASSHNPAILEAVQQSNESHAFHAKVLGEIKEQSLSTPSDAAPTTTLTDPKLTEDLDGLKADLQALKENIEVGFASSNENVVGLSSKIETIVTTVEEHRAADQSSEVLAAVQRSNDSHTSHAEVLEGIRSQGGNLPPVIYDSNFSALEEKIVALQEMLKSHGGTLDEIKGANISTSREIMPAEGDTSADFTTIINTLNSHTDMLCEIKDDVSAEILTALHDIGQSQATQSSLLAEIREADVSEEILTALHTSNESHSAHTAILDELKSTRSFESAEPVERVLPSESSNTGVLETQIAALTASLEEHKSALVEIKEATNASNESHTAHATALDELKSRPERSAQAAETVPQDVTNSPDFPAMESHLQSIISTLELHNSKLAEIEEAAKSAEVLTAVKESHTLITTNHDLIAAQAPILESIKDASLTTDILSSISELKAAVEESKTGFAAHGDLVKELHSDTKSSHSDLAAAIGGLALGGASSTSTDGDAKSAEIFEEVKAIRTVVENSSTSIDATKESVTSIASQIDINHTTVTTSITTLSDELKAEIDATGTQISESISILTSDVNAIDVAPLNTSIESCNASVADLKSSVKALSTSVDSTDSKLNALSSGVHFNDLGIDQLKEHTTVPERRESIPEAAWFGKKSSPVISRAVIDHSDTDVETEKEYNYLSPVAEESPVQDTTPLPNMAEVVNEKTEEIEPEEPAVIESIENPEEAAEAPLPPIEEAEAVPEEVVDSRAIKASPVPSKTQSIKDDDDELDENPLSLPVSRQHSPEPPIVKGSSFAEPEEELPKTPVVHEFEEATPAPEQEEQEAEADPELEAEPAPSFEPTPASEEEEPPVPAVKKNEELVEPTPEVETKEADIDEESAPMAKIEEPKEETDPQGKEIDSEGPATPSPTPAVNLDEENEHTTAAESKGKSIDLDLESEGPLSPPLATPPLDSFGESAEVDDSPDATEPESASASQSTSAIASPSSPSFPLSPTSGEKKGKKGKKEKKEKKVKEKKGGKKKEKVPFVMDGDEPED
ncbi:hypothetical protein BGZ60DRAFT_385391 [Tricladium varicosporioides]|nr:hypothetical protein BGZ60DRAFT_385391 [Hymenoscyphus varicosporioides]